MKDSEIKLPRRKSKQKQTPIDAIDLRWLGHSMIKESKPLESTLKYCLKTPQDEQKDISTGSGKQ